MKYLLRNKTGGGCEQWTHVSKQADTVKLRQFCPEYREQKLSERVNAAELDRLNKSSERFEISFITTKTEDALDFRACELKVDDRADQERWRAVIERLEELWQARALPNSALCVKAPASGVAKRIIPQTRLRRFYESLRLFSSFHIHEALAGYLSDSRNETCNHLQVLFEESFHHFSKYDCSDTRFQNRASPGWRSDYLDETQAFAYCVQARCNPEINKGPHKVSGRDGLDFIAVDYELSPLRTPNGALFEDGKPGNSSGAGGMDLLLRSEENGLPVVCEVKAKGDTNMFLALVQSLTYISEFSTGNQIRRLCRENTYRNDFGKLSDTSQWDAYVIFPAGDEPKLLHETKGIADRLLKAKDSPIGSRVRKIAFITAKFEASRAISFNCVHLSH